ncbi:MAG: restriction endonuclease subunit S [Bacteroidales bacterium]|nr:restriction endonuclease subunit S [Bacteroidales bacterium]
MINQTTFFDKYPTYKDSGVDWLGEIPEHWEVLKLKHIFFEKKKKTNYDLNCGSISFGKVVTKDDEKIPEATKASYQEVLKGDFLINPLNLNYDLISLRIALSEIDVVVSSGYIVINNLLEISKSYFKWLLHRYDVAYMKLLGSGVRQTISFNHIANSLLAFPPIHEQAAIATFLDRKTTQIDQVIAQKERMIELLKERRQILIQNAVTRGLNSNVKMRDSGVEWIGEIPEHWGVKALKYIANLQSGETISAEKFVAEGYPVYGGNGFRGYASYYTNDGEFALIGRQGALCGNVNYAVGKFFASEHAIVVYPFNGESFIWIGEAIKVADFNRLSQSAAQPGIAVSVIKNVLFPYPPISEQYSIAKYIERISDKVATATSLKEREIEKLKEYKAALINSAVTGKIKVVD